MNDVERERRRCVQIIEKHMHYAESLDKASRRKPGDPPGAAGLLLRLRNMIAGGSEPIEFGEQMAQVLEDLRPKRKRRDRSPPPGEA